MFEFILTITEDEILAAEVQSLKRKIKIQQGIAKVEEMVEEARISRLPLPRKDRLNIVQKESVLDKLSDLWNSFNLHAFMEFIWNLSAMSCGIIFIGCILYLVYMLILQCFTMLK